jgi:20S proteasome alpha/beta subunit
MSDLTDPLGLITHGGFWRFPACQPAICAGHADNSNPHVHSTDLGGVLGDFVAVTQTDGQPPAVSLIEATAPQWDLTPAEARVLALHLLLGADLAERFAAPSPTADAVRSLAESLAAV